MTTRTTELLDNHRLLVPLPWEGNAHQSLCDTISFPSDLGLLAHLSIVASTNSVTLGVLIAAEAVSELLYMTLELLHLHHLAVADEALIELSGLKHPWAQVAMSEIKKGQRNQNSMAPQNLDPSLEVVAALGRCTPPCLGIAALFYVGAPMPQAS